MFEVGYVVSSGTLRDYDLLSAFASTIRTGGGTVCDDAETLLAMSEGDFDDLDDEQRETVSWLINEDLWYELSRLAPDGCYFGTHEGDGALFGFWLIGDED